MVQCLTPTLDLIIQPTTSSAMGRDQPIDIFEIRMERPIAAFEIHLTVEAFAILLVLIALGIWTFVSLIMTVGKQLFGVLAAMGGRETQGKSKGPGRWSQEI